jgi:hypothetical protein
VRTVAQHRAFSTRMSLPPISGDKSCTLCAHTSTAVRSRTVRRAFGQLFVRIAYFPLRSAAMNGSVTGGGDAVPLITTSRGNTLGP